MKAIIVIILLAVAQSVLAIIPITSWPKVLHFEGKQICNPSASTCVRAGYRMLTPKPATPEGKRIKSEKIIQDDKDSSKCKYDITYEDIPEPPPPEVLTNVASDKVVFKFTTNGVYRGMTWIDAPITNIAVIK